VYPYFILIELKIITWPLAVSFNLFIVLYCFTFGGNNTKASYSVEECFYIMRKKMEDKLIWGMGEATTAKDHMVFVSRQSEEDDA
jgi:hypothetical protein